MRAPFQLGPYAVRYRFTPVADLDATVHGEGADALRDDLLGRLAKGPVRWDFAIQGFLDPARTPMDDHRASAAYRSAMLFARESAEAASSLCLSSRGFIRGPIG